MAFYRASIGGGGGGGELSQVIKYVTGNNSTAATATITSNTDPNLYAVLWTNSSNAQYRDDNSRINSVSGASYTLIDDYEEGTSRVRLYKLTNCQSTVSVVPNSTTSNAAKNVLLLK